MHLNQSAQKNIDNNILHNKNINFKSSKVITEIGEKATRKITDKSLQILGAASGAIVTATIAMNKKNSTEHTVPKRAIRVMSYEEFVKKISLIKEQRQDNCRHYASESLYENYLKNPELFEKLIDLKMGKEYILDDYSIVQIINKENKRIYANKIIEIAKKQENIQTSRDILKYLELGEELPDEILDLINVKNNSNGVSISSFHIKEFLEFYKHTPELCKELLEQKNEFDESKWSDYEIINLLKIHSINPDLSFKLKEYSSFSLDLGYILDILKIDDQEEKDFCLALLDNSEKRLRFPSRDIEEIRELRKIDEELANKIALMRSSDGEFCWNRHNYKDLLNLSPIKREYIIYLIKHGISVSIAFDYIKEEKFERILYLFKNGITDSVCSIANDDKKFEEIKAKIENNNNPLNIFFKNPNYMKILQQHSAGKYQAELLKMFSPDNISFELKGKLINSDMTVEDFLSTVKKISKSSFKLAYDTPNQYLSGIDNKYSTTVNGHYPKLPTSELITQRLKIINFFSENILELCRVLKYVDNDTVNHLMDKRTDLFEEHLKTLANLPDEKLEVLSELLKCKSQRTNKQLSPKEKQELCKIITIFDFGKFDLSKLKEEIEKGCVDINNLKRLIQIEVLKNAGVDTDEIEIEDCKKFNEEYAYLALRANGLDALPENVRTNLKNNITLVIEICRKKEERENMIAQCENILNNKEIMANLPEAQINIMKRQLEIFKNADKYSDKEIFNILWSDMNKTFNHQIAGKDKTNLIIKVSTLGDFKEFITDINNEYGQANAKTAEIFEKKGLNIKQWLNPSIPVQKININDKEITIKLWERNPQEDLFLGNKTTCCTAIAGANGAATSIYLLSHCWQVVEIYDDKGNVIGMSRIYMGEIDGEPALMMDNIELNKTFVKEVSIPERTKLRDAIFKYMHDYAEAVTGKKDTKVYFYTQDNIVVPKSGLKEILANVNFIGENPTEEIYVNSAKCSWINTKKLVNLKSSWYVVPKGN